MAEKAEPASGRHLRLHRDPAEALARAPAWFGLQGALEAAPEPARPLVEWLALRLFPPEEDEDAPPDETTAPPLVDLETAWAAVEALRAAILAPRQGLPAGAKRELHRRLDREARDLALDALGRSVGESRVLLRDVSHDIRSPLNSVLFLADTLLSEHSGTLNEVQRRQVGVLYTAAVTLVGLVNDLIDASRIGEGHEIAITHSSFTVDGVLSDLKSLLGPLATHRGCKLRFQVETVGPRSGDRQLLSRVLINLVTNAVHAAGDRGTVEIRVAEPREGRLRVVVHDDGAGDDPERLRRLVSEEVDPYRAGRTTGWTHGLGLAISSRLVRGAGGTMEVDSARGEGTTFTVELPFPPVE